MVNTCTCRNRGCFFQNVRKRCRARRSEEYQSPYLSCPATSVGPYPAFGDPQRAPAQPARSETWFDDPKSVGLKVALAKELGLGGVGVFTGENAGGDEEYWKALTGINSRPRLKSDDGGERQPQDESCEADAAEEAGAGSKPSRAEELLVAALRQDQAAWKPGRAVPPEFWVEALPECGPLPSYRKRRWLR